jgi:site-specific DNA-cytosine methylase
VDNPFKSPAVLSFCPGILGIERGLARAGISCRVAAYVEIEAFIIANLVAGMESGLVDPAPIWTDAKTFDARPFRGKIHGIIGGYPCPGESVAGLREGHLYKGFLWPSIRKAISAANPPFCFFENVDDHLTGTYPIVQRSLRHMGYAVEAGIYSADEVGASHERQRLFILALANPYRDELRRRFGKIQGKEETAKGETWNQYRQWLRNELSDGSSEVADARSSGLQGMQPRQVSGSRQTISGSIAQCSTKDFPIGQGFEQWNWEEPREISPQSGMGSTIDGYNFASDLLRALGNSVVEQTAELAFVELLYKHFKN